MKIITVGGAFEPASRRFVEAWRRGERGETFHERHLAYANWDALARVLTGRRMELLHKALGRGSSNARRRSGAVSGGAARHKRGPITGRLRADYDVIDTKIAI